MKKEKWKCFKEKQSGHFCPHLLEQGQVNIPQTGGCDCRPERSSFSNLWKKSQLSIHFGLRLFSLSLALICYLCRRVERVDVLLSAVDSCFWPHRSMHFVIVFIFMHAIELEVIFFLLLLGSLRPFCYFSTPSTQSEVSWLQWAGKGLFVFVSVFLSVHIAGKWSACNSSHDLGFEKFS